MEHEQLSDQAQSIQPGIYQHFKGGMYQVLGIGRHSENEEEMVFYQQLYDDYTWWCRPVKMFLENVERDGYSGPRFKFVSKNR